MLIIAILLLFIGLWHVQRVIYEKHCFKKLDMELTFSADEAFEGENLTLIEDITNAKMLPLVWLEAGFQLPKELVFENVPTGISTDNYNQRDMFSIGMYRHIVRRQNFTCAKRGHYRVQNMCLSTTDIFGRETYTQNRHSSATLTVFPRLLNAETTQVLFSQINGEIERHRFINPDPFSFRGIRNYLPGDDFKSINFKASAKTGDLMVNIHSASVCRQVEIILNLESAQAYANPAIKEEAIRLCATIAGNYIQDGLSVGIQTNAKHTNGADEINILPGSGNAHFFTILRALAAIDLQQSNSAMHTRLNKDITLESNYILISNNTDAQMQAAVEKMRESGLFVYWLVPLFKDEVLPLNENDSTSRWNITPVA